jgi:hypothetical protein
MGQLLKLGNTLKEYIKDIAPRFNYLNQEQVNRLDDLIKMVYDIYDDTLSFALEELQLARGVGANEELVASQQLMGEVNKQVIQRLPNLQQLIINYNPIQAPVNAGSVSIRTLKVTDIRWMLGTILGNMFNLSFYYIIMKNHQKYLFCPEMINCTLIYILILYFYR